MKVLGVIRVLGSISVENMLDVIIFQTRTVFVLPN